MRYELNQKLFGVQFEIDNQDGIGKKIWVKPFLFNYDQVVEKINIVELTVNEHHKVTNGYTDEKECDGFILSDKDNNVWHNQYPTASYGQLSDEGDRIFERAVTVKGELNTLLEKGDVLQCYLLTDFYRSAVDGLSKLENTHPIFHKLLLLKEELENKMNVEHNLKFEYTPHFFGEHELPRYELKPV